MKKVKKFTVTVKTDKATTVATFSGSGEAFKETEKNFQEMVDTMRSVDAASNLPEGVELKVTHKKN